MTTGALVYATDGDIQYTRIAEECARRVEQYLNIPVTIVLGNSAITGKRSWADCDTAVEWRNSGRCNALEDSPYERTLLIDADYWIASDCCKHLLNATGSFYAYNIRMYINEPHAKTETFGTLKTPMWWATVCVFDRSQFTQDVFECWQMIEHNYDHYANLFHFNRHPFRNDFALSMALLVVNGGEYPDCAIPWPLVNVPDSCEIALDDKKWTMGYTVYENDQHKQKRITVQNQDLHIMGKRNLEKLLELQG